MMVAVGVPAVGATVRLGGRTVQLVVGAVAITVGTSLDAIVGSAVPGPSPPPH